MNNNPHRTVILPVVPETLRKELGVVENRVAEENIWSEWR
jgi:hypothetical protein